MRSRTATSIVALLVGGLIACQDTGSSADGQPLATEPGIEDVDPVSVQLAKLPPDVQKGLADLRAAVSPLHNLDVAIAAGFDTDLTGCLENPPIGGMGHHYGMIPRIDGAPPVADEPELLVFSPKSNGKLQLGAVEFIIPYAAWTPTDPPELFGQTFHRNDDAGLWVLHVWLWNHNPDGLFADWNPTVSCP
jgi:hypothetical protein